MNTKKKWPFGHYHNADFRPISYRVYHPLEYHKDRVGRLILVSNPQETNPVGVTGGVTQIVNPEERGTIKVIAYIRGRRRWYGIALIMSTLTFEVFDIFHYGPTPRYFKRVWPVPPGIGLDLSFVKNKIFEEYGLHSEI